MKKAGPKPILMVRKDKCKGKAKAKVKAKDIGKAKPNKGKAVLKPKGRTAKGGKCFHCDILYALSMISWYQVDPDEGHWVAVKNILKYLRRTKDTILIYRGEKELSVKSYTDASFQTYKDDSQTQSDFVFFLNGGAVSWKRSKQDTIVYSTTKAEYIATSDIAKESFRIKKFIYELEVVPSISNAIELFCNNNGVIAHAKEPKSH
ncbi:secreted RxLR effector protein 161-like [Gossypium raimondii]|uniref:secreted RxLR effector protein 161-like n=1 Tax=Gossypium raimondii TaxID=29730 RepID=UPI00227C0946|nr:secreted RxLR effector protein 161-like [Gossypium raimondii]